MKIKKSCDINKKLTINLGIKFLLLILFLSIIVLSIIELSYAAGLTCEFKKSCNSSQTALLRAQNGTLGYNNTHVQIINYTGTAYNWTLCCNDQGYTLNNSCDYSGAKTILKAYNVTNSHIQIPSVATYNYDICLAAEDGNLTCDFQNDSCTGTKNAIFSMASTGTNGGLYNTSNAHIGDADRYRLKACCGINATTPSTPILLYPVDGNSSVFERNVVLNWSPSTGTGQINYTLNLTVAPGSCAVEYYVVNFTSTNFTTNRLCVDQVYSWSVIACDDIGCSDWSTPFNFTIASTLGIKFLVNKTDFGTVNITNQYTTETGTPLVVENDGNVNIDVNIKANDALFTTVPLNRTNFMYRVAENETGSFNTAASQITWYNVTASYTMALINLSDEDANDDAKIHFNVTIPDNEPPGTLTSTLMVQAIAS